MLLSCRGGKILKLPKGPPPMRARYFVRIEGDLVGLRTISLSKKGDSLLLHSAERLSVGGIDIMDTSFVLMDTLGKPLYSFKRIVQMGIEIGRKEVEYRGDTLLSRVLGPDGLFYDTLKVEGVIYDMEELIFLPLFLMADTSKSVMIYTGTKGKVDSLLILPKGEKVLMFLDKRKYEVKYLESGIPSFFKDRKTGIEIELSRK